MPKRKPAPARPLLGFMGRMYAVRLSRNDGSAFLACGAHGHPRLHLDREEAEKFLRELTEADCTGGRVVPVYVAIKQLRK